MNGVIFLLLLVICVGLIYIVHRYFGKHEFYLLSVIYSIISFVMSFKMVKILGLNINMGIIFIGGIIGLLYYFVNKYNDSESKKFIITIMISTISSIVIMLLSAMMIPSIYDENIVLFKDLLFDNYAILIFYPIGLLGTLLFANYSFKGLKKIEVNKKINAIISIIGITFINVFVGIYFSSAINNGFRNSHFIAIDNYFIMTIIMIGMYFLVNKIIKIKKVNS